MTQNDVDQLLAYLRPAKRERYAEDRTWASSGPPWDKSAEDAKAGWDDCVKAIEDFKRGLRE